MQNIKQFEIKVSLLANSSAQGQKLLKLYDFDWIPLSENTSESNFDLSKASQNQKTYYKIRYVVQQELIEYIFDADGNEIEQQEQKPPVTLIKSTMADPETSGLTMKVPGEYDITVEAP